MAIEFKCVRCGKLLRVGDDTAGRQAKCPSCDEMQPIPVGAEVAVEAEPSNDPPPLPTASPMEEMQTRQWAMFLHLSQFASLIVPLAGLIVPIVIWQIKKTELPGIDVHGKIVVNWLISATIYAVVSILLTFVVIGVPMLLILGVLAIVFPIIGAIKANNGEAWKYPLSISFF